MSKWRGFLHETIEAISEGWRQGAPKLNANVSLLPPSRLAGDVRVGLYLAWSFLFLLFVLWILA
jgi:hypothetical protein